MDDFLIGGTAGIVARTVTAPIELFKLQRQNHTRRVIGGKLTPCCCYSMNRWILRWGWSICLTFILRLI